MGGMAAQIPIKSDPEANEAAMNKVRSDKLREVKEGHDGTWVAHPGLVPIAKEVFDAHMGTPNQINGKKTLTRDISVGDLITSPVGVCTEKC
jgi:malate synthase